jgi:hypothetical protein
MSACEKCHSLTAFHEEGCPVIASQLYIDTGKIETALRCPTCTAVLVKPHDDMVYCDTCDHELSAEEVARAKLARLPPPADRCDPGCSGWFIDAETFEPTRCDECWGGISDPLYDDDVAALPEAQAERAVIITRTHNEDHGTCYGLFAEWCPHCLKKISWLKRR